jgi:hypothetical protein
MFPIFSVAYAFVPNAWPVLSFDILAGLGSAIY